MKIGKKNFTGNLFDRFSGLEYLFEKCSGQTILDIASCEGLVSYEFARNGAILIHGFEKDNDRVKFSKRLFRDIPVTSKFSKLNLVEKSAKLEKKMLYQYDIVLFLGIYHTLVNQKMKSDKLQQLIKLLLKKTKKWFAIRTPSMMEVEKIIISSNFKLVYSSDSNKKVGLLHIYEKV